MTEPRTDTVSDRELLEAIVESVLRVESHVEAQIADLRAEVNQALTALWTVRGTRPADPRHERLVAALADSLDAFDEFHVPFFADEVMQDREQHHELDEALRVNGITTVAALGLLFRELRDRPIAGFRLLRDGRGWRLERCT
jgi:hypothetical protein